MFKDKNKIKRKSIIIDKRRQSNAEQLIRLFETIENIEIDISKDNGVVRVSLPEVQKTSKFRRQLNILSKGVFSANNEQQMKIGREIRQISGIVIK